MKKLLPLIFVTLLLAGCTSQGSTKMTDDQIFQKKQECVGYTEKAKSFIKEYQNERIKVEKDLGVFLKYQYSLGEIFYSPIENSCLYSVHVIEEPDGEPIQDIYMIWDLFDKEYSVLGIVVADENGKIDNDQSFFAYKKKLKELKGE